MMPAEIPRFQARPLRRRAQSLATEAPLRRDPRRGGSGAPHGRDGAGHAGTPATDGRPDARRAGRQAVSWTRCSPACGASCTTFGVPSIRTGAGSAARVGRHRAETALAQVAGACKAPQRQGHVAAARRRAREPEGVPVGNAIGLPQRAATRQLSPARPRLPVLRAASPPPGVPAAPRPGRVRPPFRLAAASSMVRHDSNRRDVGACSPVPLA